MATVYSSEVSVGTYNRIRIKCDYSGTSATLTIQFRRTSSYTGTWGDAQATLTLGGTEKAAAYNYTGTVGESWVDLRAAISGYTISTSGGTYNWVFNNPGSSSVLGCSGTITIPAQSTAPTDLAISNISSTTNTVTATVSVSSWGGSGDANSRYRNLSVLETSDKSTSPRRYERVYGNTMSSAITVDNNTQYGSMTIQPNTRYWLWWYATNGTDGVSSPDTSTTTVVTLAEAATVSLSSVTTTSATISFSTAADGGYYTKWVQYSRDNGNTWVTAYNVTTGSATSSTVTVTGLTPGTNYTFKTRVATTAGNTNGSDVTFTTTSIVPPDGPELYGSASNQTTKVTDLYGSDNGVATRVTKVYGLGTYEVYTVSLYLYITAVDGYKLCKAVKESPQSSQYYTQAKKIKVTKNSANSLTLDVLDSSSTTIFSVTGDYDTIQNVYGVTVDSNMGTSQRITTPMTYSSSQKSRLVYQGFGHVDYGP